MSKQYDKYLKNHITNVEKGLNYIFNHMPELLFGINKKQMFDGTVSDSNYAAQFKKHDESKYSFEEYFPYDEYFYGKNKSFKVVNDFNYAWLHHIHNNPHHWQYWVLVQDDEKDKCLEMPYNYIIEMICDWWSFSWQKENLYEIFDWYSDHKNKIMLAPKTREIVETILKKIKESLDNKEDDSLKNK